MKCAVCNRGPAQGVSLFRMNATGQKGLWACNEHKDQFDGRIDPVVKEIAMADRELIERLRYEATTIWRTRTETTPMYDLLQQAADRLSALSSEVERLKGALREIRTHDRSVTVGGEWGDWRWAGKKAADALREDYRTALSGDAG